MASKPGIVESLKTTLGWQPPRVPTDTVVPLQPYDSNLFLQGLIIRPLYAFDAVLSTAKLRRTLWAVVELEGWQRFGARLRRRGVVDLEYHIPAKFSSSRPAVHFTEVTFDMSIKDHLEARHLMAPVVDTAINTYNAPYDGLLLGEDTPKHDYLNSDLPLLGLHIILFSDATLVMPYLPHCLTDGAGFAALFSAWVLMLQGKECEIPTPFAVEVDPLGDVDESASESTGGFLSAEQSSALSWTRYLMANMNRVLFTTKEFRTIVIPPSQMKRLRERATQDLLADRSADNPPTRLTNGDILFAWWACLALSHLPRNSKTPAAILTAISLRHYLPGSLVLNNLLDTVAVVMETSFIRKRPLGQVANQIRTLIKSSQTPEHLKSYASWWRASKMGVPQPFGTPDSTVIGVLNVAMADLFDLDFSSAAIGLRSSQDDGSKRIVKPVNVQIRVFGCDPLDISWIVGKDGNSNHWLSCAAQNNLSLTSTGPFIFRSESITIYTNFY
ncbi:Acetyltransferase adrJ [Cladobotryum mycophilum]|uniref:Acetyltransferase adrJ n=1 Tax=Cladobotryum mycophilum TaxID=491253 RepID=A0ABR0S9C5_9HYPO